MMKNIVSELFAILNSSRFTAYQDGVLTEMPTGEKITLKIHRTYRTTRPVGLRFSNFAFVTEIEGGGHLGFGFGEARTELLALQKSIAEGVERCVFRILKNSKYGSDTSNGWAAHVNANLARRSALNELMERDAVLVHWLCQRPLTEIDSSSWPGWLSRWTAQELALGSRFRNLRVLSSNCGYVPTATAVLESADGHAVLSHSTDSTLATALSRALAEACRIAHIAISEKSDLATEKTESFSIMAHALYYAREEKLPSWLFGDSINWKDAEYAWRMALRRHDPMALKADYESLAVGPLTVVRAKSEMLQKLFVGRSNEARANGAINLSRLNKSGYGGLINSMPHCVP